MIPAHEAELRALFDAAPIGIVRSDAGGRVLAANDVFLAIVGMTRADLNAGQVRWDELTPPDCLCADETAIAEAVADPQGRCHPYEKDYVRADGSRVPVLLSFKLLDRRTGEFACFVVDLTRAQRRNAPLGESEARLRREVRRGALLVEVSQAILEGEQDEAALAALVFGKVSAHLDADVCLSYALDPDGQTLRLVAGFGVPPELADAARSLQVGQAFCGTAAAIGEPLAADAAMIASDERGALMHGMGVRAYACHPLRRSDGRLLGTLSFASTRRDGFGADEVAFLGRVCHFVALAWKRRRDMAALAEGEAHLRSLLEASTDCVKVIEPDSGLSFMNANGCSLMEIDDFSAIRGREWASLWPEEGRGRIRAAFAKALAGAEDRFEAACPTAKGTLKWWDVAVSPIRDGSGRVARVVSVLRDLTSRKQTEAAFAESEILARAQADEIAAIYDAAPIGLCVIDRGLRYVRINGRMAEINGVAAADHIGRTVREVVPSLEQQAIEMMGRVLGGEALLGIEVVGTTPAQPGIVRTWRENWLPMRDRTGQIVGVTVSAEDVTAEKAAEARQAYFLALGETLHNLDEPAAMMDAACAALGRTLKAAQVGFAEVEADGEHVVVRRDWNDGAIPSNVGRWRMDDFGPAFIRDMKAGATIVVPDVTLDPRTRMPAALAAFEGVNTRAILNVPLIRHGRQVAMLFINHPMPRAWAPDEVSLVEETCRRLWDAVERARAEAALVESETRLRLFVERAPAAIAMFDTGMRYLAASRRYLQDYGLDKGVRPEALIGRSHYHVFPEMPDRWREVHRRVIAGETVAAEDDPVPRGDGHTDWVRWEMTPWRHADGSVGGVLLFSEVVTARIEAERALAKSEARFRAAVQAVSGVMWTNNAHGKMEGEQPAWAALTGQTFAEYQGYGWACAVHPEDAQPTIDAWNAVVTARRTFVFEHRVRRHDGVWRPFAVRAIPVLHEDGSVHEWVGVHTDVTDQREAEAVLSRDRDELERLVAERTQNLHEAQQRLAHAQRMEALGQLAGGIAHDFNNVIQAVQGGVALIEKRVDQDDVRRLARLVAEAAARGSSVTSRLLAFARRGELRVEAVNPAELLGSLHEILTHALGGVIDLRVETGPGLPMLLADKSQLETVLVNLATNARDAMPGGGVLTISARLQAMDVRERDGTAAGPAGLTPGRYVCIAVADTGAGMAPDVLARASEPFFTTKEQGKGTGLGLAMAKGFAEQSGGALTIESAPGRGTVVTLWFPLAAGLAAGTPAAKGVLMARGGNARILLVDDDAAVREVMAEGLGAEGYDVLPAQSGADALALLDAGRAVDLVVSDLSMPGLDGIATIQAAQQRRPGLPAILLTGFATDAAELAAGSAISGPFDLVRKPVTAGHLAEQVAILLDGLAVGGGAEE